jgi:hypothetical protein
MTGPMMMMLILASAGVFALIEMVARSKQSDHSSKADQDMVNYVDHLETRVRDLERILTDPDENLKRDIDRL